MLVRTSGKANAPWELLSDLCEEPSVDEDDKSVYCSDSRKNLNNWLRAASGTEGVFVSKKRNGTLHRRWRAADSGEIAQPPPPEPN